MPTNTTWRDYLQAALWGAGMPAACYIAVLIRDLVGA